MKNSKDDPDGMPLDNLEKIQVERVNSLKRVLQNFKKDPVSRKSEPYFAKRLQQIDDINAAALREHITFSFVRRDTQKVNTAPKVLSHRSRRSLWKHIV
ncbi:hypothetical protein ACLKA6_009746 [Drosophila palustris]